MSDSIDGWKAAEVLGGVAMTVLGWFGKDAMHRIRALEKSTVTREELKECFEQMREDRKAMHVENKDSLRRIEDKLDATEHKGVIATRVDRAERDVEDLRTWKHQVDPLIERKVGP